MNDALALYVHWPFCKAKCPYCDFNSHVREAVDQDRWRTALLSELDHALDGLEGRRLTSIFFGGGTPSLMPPETAGAVISRAIARAAPDPDIEITLEANPTSVEADRFRAYRDAGVNRVSLGVQSFNPDALAFLGREHSAEDAIRAIELARDVFPRISFDLIYARPGQTAAAWAAELERAVELTADHLSLYQLTIEAGTRFFTRARQGECMTADEETGATLYEATQERLDSLGLGAYEVSNHARPGAESRHNLAYWRYQDYVGIGPGAHGRVTVDGVKWATVRERLPERWLDRVGRDGHGLNDSVPVDRDQQFQEILMMGLRLQEGVQEQKLRDATGQGFESIPPDRFKDLVEAGYVTLSDGTLRTTMAGRIRLNALLDHLLNA